MDMSQSTRNTDRLRQFVFIHTFDALGVSIREADSERRITI